MKTTWIIGGILFFLWWRSQAAVTATTLGSAGNPTAVTPPAGSSIPSLGNGLVQPQTGTVLN